MAYPGESRKRRSDEEDYFSGENRGSDFWTVTLMPSVQNCFFQDFNFTSASVLEASNTTIQLGYDSDVLNPTIDFAIKFNTECSTTVNMTDMEFDRIFAAPVMPRFFSIDRNDAHYQIEFGWDTIGYMYVFGNMSQLIIPNLLLGMPCAVVLDANSTHIVSYKSGTFA